MRLPYARFSHCWVRHPQKHRVEGQKLTGGHCRCPWHNCIYRVCKHTYSDPQWHTIQQRKWFLPLAKEAKYLVEEIHIEKLNEQLAPLELAKQHLPADIIDILECLGKSNNIPFNQLYYITDNYTNRYYSKVIETFVSIIKRQFANRQTLLVNTAHSLKFLEEYLGRQVQIWKIFHKHHNIPDDIEDLHLHFDSIKTSLET